MTAAIALVAITASFLTLIASTFLLWRYRRTIARLMSAHARGRDHPVVNGAHFKRDTSLLLQDSDTVESDPISDSCRNRLAESLYHETKSGPRRHAFKYAIAGVLFALLVGTAGFFAFSQTQVNSLRAADHPLQFLFMVWTFAWPIVLTTNIVAAASQWNQWLNVLLYFVVLMVLGGVLVVTATESLQVGGVSVAAWSGETPIRLVSKWSLFNFAPTLLIVIFRNRRVRAVAPLVLSFMTVVSAGVLTPIAAVVVFQELAIAAIESASHTLGVSFVAVLIGYFLLICTAACLLSGVIGWYVLARIRSAYQRRLLSDQSIAIDALWLVFASFYAVILASAGPAWALSPIAAFLIYKTVVTIGNKRWQQQSDSLDDGRALLVLRVFALGKRSEILFDALTQRWRHVGSVKLIAGTDLALSTVAPHQFLAFVSGKITQLFIRSDTAIDVLDHGRDADGRFRINDFFCHADTWQGVLKKLIKNTGAVLMDLRSLTEANAGCVFEIRELLSTVPLEQLVFVVDETTDKNFLKQTLGETCRELPADSPNVGLSGSALQPFELNSVGHHEVQNLIRRICAAVGFRPPRLSPA